MTRKILHFLFVVIFFSVFSTCGTETLLTSDEAEGDNTNSNESESSQNTETSAYLAGKLLIDGSVHTGTDWSGNSYTGVWGENFDFDMSDYPITWAIALVHASKLLKSRGVNYSPNAVLSVAIKESSLGCLKSDFPNDDGCFQIEGVYNAASKTYVSAYGELVTLFPERFPNSETSHDDIISGAHFETSALSLVYYTLFSEEMFHLYSDDPQAFFDNHPISNSQQKVISAAYNRGLWWTALDNVFKNCAEKEVTECFVENSTPHTIAIDHANAIADYTAALDAAEPFDVELGLQDLKDYWTTIAKLYTDVSEEEVLDTLTTSFNALQKNSKVSFKTDLDPILDDLVATLPAVPTSEETLDSICDLGYLWKSPPCP